ncbi:MAG: hypothetical protein HC811_09505 [Flammeovirgaceae bacterium]|nr:hypothetical protein [Flammeovirgaceae bacterium]
MEVRDLIVTPVVLGIIYLMAYLIRPYVTDSINRKYFLPALTLRIFGAIALGFLYQFYYNGGDTFNYHTYGSRIIWEAFIEDPGVGLKLMLSSGDDYDGVYKYASRILFYSDPDSYFVIRLTAFLDLFTFSSYAATAVLFAVLSFAGTWMMYIAFYGRYPKIHFGLAVAILFFPSVIFWGAGILKDTVVMGCLGFMTYSIDKIERRKFMLFPALLLVVCTVTIFIIKKYVLLCYLPAALIWFFGDYLIRIRSVVLKWMLAPILIGVIGFTSYWAVFKIGESDAKYSLSKLAITAKITAYDIGFYTGRDAGSSYSLGDLDGTFTGMLQLFPQAVNVSLFRPYLWEVSNPLMLLTALESLILLLATLYILLKIRFNIIPYLNNPIILFHWFLVSPFLLPLVYQLIISEHWPGIKFHYFRFMLWLCY